MALQCNIDGRGKRARLISGIVMLIVALAVAATWAWPERSVVGWGIAVILLLAGAFAIFQSVIGWCAMRALGFKTRI
jgi:uncharacterized membrane protein